MSSETPAAENSALPRKSWGVRILLVLVAAVVAPIVATVLYTYSPTEYRFYPICFFYFVTGFHCPGCGATRCTAALLHGNLPQAFAYNPLLVLLLPLIFYCGSRIAYEMWTGKKARGIHVPNWLMRGLVVVFLAYWIARNISVYPFTLLAPHDI